jgi:hypothetical protein
MRDGVLDFGTVVLAPDAAVLVRLRNVPAGCQGRADCSVADDDRFQSSKLQDVRPSVTASWCRRRPGASCG